MIPKQPFNSINNYLHQQYGREMQSNAGFMVHAIIRVATASIAHKNKGVNPSSRTNWVDAPVTVTGRG
eukprot:4719489-Ditylum_brightwellii.AAC.1